MLKSRDCSAKLARARGSATSGCLDSCACLPGRASTPQVAGEGGFDLRVCPSLVDDQDPGDDRVGRALAEGVLEVARQAQLRYPLKAPDFVRTTSKCLMEKDGVATLFERFEKDY